MIKPLRSVAVAILAFQAVFALVLCLAHYARGYSEQLEIVTQMAGGDYAARQYPRFRQNPALTASHLVPSIAFILIGATQLSKRSRLAYPKVHRWLGRLFALTTVVISITGILISIVLNYTGVSEIVPSLVFGTLSIVSVILGVRRARQKHFVAHREWMLRAYAVALGIVTARLALFGFTSLTGEPASEFFGTIFWLGSGSNLLGVEVWINLTRAKPRPLGKVTSSLANAG
jgi:uncharacterized membrane protein